MAKRKLPNKISRNKIRKADQINLTLDGAAIPVNRAALLKRYETAKEGAPFPFTASVNEDGEYILAAEVKLV